MKKQLSIAAVLLSLCVLFSGCSSPSAAGTAAGSDIPSGLYLYAQYEAYVEASGSASEDQDPSKVSDFLKASVTTEEGAEPIKVSDFVAGRTEETLRSYYAVEALFDELGGTLTEDRLREADSAADRELQARGEEYSANGIGEQTLRLVQRNAVKRSMLPELLYGKNGRSPVSDEELSAYIQNDMFYGIYVNVPLYSTATFVPADEAQRTEMLRLAGEAAAGFSERIRSAIRPGDPDTALPHFYSELYEDLPGIYKAMNVDYDPSALSGELNTELFTVSDLTEYFGEETANSLSMMEYGDATAFTYNDFGMLIMLRADPLASQSLDDIRGVVLSRMKSEDTQKELDDRAASLELSLNSGSTQKLPASKIRF